MGRHVVLLVEDNPDDVEMILRVFQKNNFANRVVVARDGVEALDCIFHRNVHAGGTPSDLPVLILLDLKLPKLDGLDVLRQIRMNEMTRAIPVVILTSSDEEQDKLKSYTLGANSYIRKPIDRDQFVEASRNLGLYWLLLNESVPRKAAS